MASAGASRRPRQTSATAASSFSSDSAPPHAVQTLMATENASQNNLAQTFWHQPGTGASQSAAYTGQPDTTGFGVLRPAEIVPEREPRGEFQDRRVRDPVPTKLKGMTDTKKGNFAVMHMEVATAEFKERHKAAKRTSESTELAAKRAMSNGYVGHNKKRGFGLPEQDLIYNGGPLGTKEDQARLLTLLRSLNPVLVVDQICKALAYFGGIPGAPPPGNGKFPESARGNGSGAVFVGWVAEIFPKLDPSIATEPGPLQTTMRVPEPQMYEAPQPATAEAVSIPSPGVMSPMLSPSPPPAAALPSPPVPPPPAAPPPPQETQTVTQTASVAPQENTPSMNPPVEKRGRGRPKGSKATKARKDKGIKKGPLKARQAGAATQPSQASGNVPDDSWVDVDSTILEAENVSQVPVNQSLAISNPARQQTPQVLAAVSEHASATGPSQTASTDIETTPLGKKRGRPKGSKNRPKDTAAASDGTPSAASAAPPTVTPIPPPRIPQISTPSSSSKKKTGQAESAVGGTSAPSSQQPRGTVPATAVVDPTSGDAQLGSSQVGGANFAAAASQFAHGAHSPSVTQTSSFTPANAPKANGAAAGTASADRVEATGAKRKRKTPKKADKRAGETGSGSHPGEQPPLNLSNGVVSAAGSTASQAVPSADIAGASLPPTKRQKKSNAQKPRPKKQQQGQQLGDDGDKEATAVVSQNETDAVMIPGFSLTEDEVNISTESFASPSSSFNQNSGPQNSQTTTSTTAQMIPSSGQSHPQSQAPGQAQFQPRQALQKSPNMIAHHATNSEAMQNMANYQQRQRQQQQQGSTQVMTSNAPQMQGSMASGVMQSGQQVHRQQMNPQQMYGQGRLDTSQYTQQQSPQMSAQYQQFTSQVQQPQLQYSLQRPQQQQGQQQHRMATSSPNMVAQGTSAQQGSPQFAAASHQGLRAPTSMSFTGGSSFTSQRSGTSSASPSLNPAYATPTSSQHALSHHGSPSFGNSRLQHPHQATGGTASAAMQAYQGFENSSLFDGLGGLDASSAGVAAPTAASYGASNVPRTSSGAKAAAAAAAAAGFGHAGTTGANHAMGAFDRFYQVRQ